MPYFGYQRQNVSFLEGECVPMEIISKFLQDLGVLKLISVDLHSENVPSYFKIPVINLSTVNLFANKIKELNLSLTNSVVVAPDKGGVKRAQELAKVLGFPVVTIKKKRNLDTGKIEEMDLTGEVKDNAIIFDDMISTGGTIIKAAGILAKMGVKNIYVFATHGVLAGDSLDALDKTPIKKIFLTNTLSLERVAKNNKYEVLSVADIIAKAL